ncbi:glycosyl hydrolase family 18 protein [Prolixibacteraceae bacterium]|nr:glycosyl hydrolase family 18 protein [Prolixibacteraceae bacterium]
MKKIYLLIIFMITLGHVNAQSQQTETKKSIRFDGTPSGVINMPDLKSHLGATLDEFTIEFFCKRYRNPEIDKWGYYVSLGMSDGKGIGIQVPKRGGFNLIFGNGVGQKSIYRQINNTPESSEWTHVAWVYKNSQFYGYINGMPVTCHVGRYDIPASIEIGDLFTLGSKIGANLRNFRVWKIARTSTQIKQNYKAVLGPTPNLVLQYAMQDSETPYNVMDSSGNDLDGTISTSSATKYENDALVPPVSKGDRIVGYIPYYRMASITEDQVALLTDAVIFSVFPNPFTGEIQISKIDSNGKRVFKHQNGGAGLKETDIERIVSYCKTHAVKSHLCIGGGDYATPFRQLVDYGNAEKFANNLTNLCIELGVEGVDIDWEFPRENDGVKVDKLFRILYNHLTPNNLSLSGAFSPYESSQRPSIMSAVRNEKMLDLINIMGYEPTMAGLYRARNVFVTKYKLPKEKVIAGVPFYTFHRPNVTTYNNMVRMALKDGQVVTPNMNQITVGGKTYKYNGVDLVKRKTEYCKKYLGGVMIWEIGQDMPADSEYSLLKAINETMNDGVKTRSSSTDNLSVEDTYADSKAGVYPSTITDHFNIRLPEQGNYRVVVYSTLGSQVLNKTYTLYRDDEQRVSLDVTSGIYIVMIYNELNELIVTTKLVK